MTNQQGAPEALRLAAEVLDWMPTSDTQRALWDRHQKALVVVKAALVEAQQPADCGNTPYDDGPFTMAQQPATSWQQPFGWIKQSEIDSSNDFGGSINLWRKKYDCDVPVYLTQQPATSAAAAVEQETDAVAKRRAKYLRNDTDAGRAYVAQYLRSMGQHYFDDYIENDLAGDFACALASVLSLSLEQQAPQPTPAPQADSAQVAAPADTVVLEAALRAIHQAIDLIGEPDTERLRTVRRVLRGAVVVAEDSKAPQADSQPAPVGGAAELLKEILAAACCEESETNLTSDQYRKLYDLHSSIQAISTPPAQAADSVLEDAARWQALPAFFEEYQIDAMKLYRDIDAYLAAARKQGGHK